MRKRILCAMFALLMVVTLLPIVAGADETSVIDLAFTQRETAVGATEISVGVDMDGNPGFVTATIPIKWDNDVLHLKSVTPSTDILEAGWCGMSMEEYISNGTYYLAWDNDTREEGDFTTTTGCLAELVFEIVNPSVDTSTQLWFDMTDSIANIMNFEMEDLNKSNTVTANSAMITVTAKTFGGDTPVGLTDIDVTVIKDTYVDGESFSKNDIVVKATYDDGTTTPVTGYTVDVGTFELTDKVVQETVTVTVTYIENGVTKSATYDVTVLPCVAIVDGERYTDLEEAIENADNGDIIELPLPGEYDVTVDKDLTFRNTSGVKITIHINDETVTIEAGDFYEVGSKDDTADSTYVAFNLQMMQWRNHAFFLIYKQTEGGTISGANTARFSQSVTFTVTPDEGYAIADVIVNGKSVGAVDAYTIKNIKSNTTVSATFEKIETETVEVEIVPETTPWANPFTDVGEMDAFYVAVQYVYENGLFKGMSNTEFGPAITMNRAMFVTVLGRLTGVNVDDFTTVTFADCEAGSWYAPYVEWAAKSGIVKGMSATEFAPNAEITVEQALTILYRYMTTMGYDLTGADALTAYADAASVSDWAMDAVQWAVANEIYEVADTLAPQSAAARSLVATLLYNLSGMLAK